MATKLYFRAAGVNSGYTGTFPSSEQSAATASNASGASHQAFTLKDLSLTPQPVAGTSNSHAYTFGSTTSQQDMFAGVFRSMPLQGSGTIGGGTMDLFCADEESNANANAWVNGIHAYVWRPGTGAKVGTIRDFASAGVSGTVGTHEPTAPNTQMATNLTAVTSTAVAYQDGDVVIVEVWLRVNMAMASNYTGAWHFDGGSTNSASENAVVSAPNSYIQFSESVQFRIAGVGNATLGPLGASGAGASTVSGSGGATLGAVISTAQGLVGTIGPVSESPAIGMSAIGMGAIGAPPMGDAADLDSEGTAAATLGAIVGVASAAVLVSGTAAASLGALASSASAAVTVSGTASATLGAVTASASAAAIVTGSASATLGAISSSASGATTVSGTATAALGAVTGTSSGALQISGSASVVLGALSAGGSGHAEQPEQPFAPSAAIAMGAIGTNALGAPLVEFQSLDAIQGSAAATLGGITASATARAIAGASSTVTLGAIGATASAQAIVSGSASTGLGAIGAAAAAGAVVSATGAATLGSIGASSSASVGVGASGAATLADVVSVAVAQVIARATAAATLQGLQSLASGIVFTPVLTPGESGDHVPPDKGVHRAPGLPRRPAVVPPEAITTVED